MSQAANEPAPQAMTQEQRTIIQQAHQIAALSGMLDGVVRQRDQLGRIVKSQSDALELANKKIDELEGKPPLAAVPAAAKALRSRKA